MKRAAGKSSGRPQKLGDLIQRSEAELMDIRNFGQKSIDEVKGKLEELGLGLNQE